MPGFDIEAARRSGATDDQILSYFRGTRQDFDFDGAAQSGASPASIIDHVSRMPFSVASEPQPGGPAVEMGRPRQVDPVSGETIPPAATPALAPPAEPPDDDDSWIGTAASAWWEGVSPVTQITGIMTALKNPVETGKGMLLAQDALRQRAVDEFREGNYGKALTAATNYLVPLLGPESQRLGDIGDEKGITSPEYVGALAGLATNLAAPAAVGKVKRVPIKPQIGQSVAEPVKQAFEFLEGKGVPVPAGVRTQNRWVRGIQEMADTSPAGSVVHHRTRQAIQEGARQTADDLVQRTGVKPISPEQAGQRVQESLKNKVAALAGKADDAYDAFRAIEADPKHLKKVQLRTEIPAESAQRLDDLSQSLAGKPYAKLSEANQKALRETASRLGIDATPQPVFAEIALPVDLRAIKRSVAPLLERTKLWPAAERSASKGYSALKEIRDAPDYVPASLAEQYLGGLKDLARSDGKGVARNADQGLASLGVSRLQENIDQAVAGQAGGRALGELRRGRRLTALKYGVDDVVKQLREEPVQAFGQMTYAKDAGIDLLRKVNKQAPGELRKVGRAWLDDLFSAVTAEGDAALLSRGQGMWSKWQSLGPETRKLLFNPMHAEDLNRFFLGMKKLSESPNPSQTRVLGMITAQGAGSAVMVLTNPATGVPYVLGMGALSKMLNSPRGVAALTKGITVPLGDRAAAAAAAGQILKLAGEDAKPYVLPKAAQSGAVKEDEQLASVF